MRIMLCSVLASAVLICGAQESLRSEEQMRLWGLTSVVDAVGFSNDGKLAVTGSGSLITIWDVQTGKWQFRLRPPPGGWGIGRNAILLPDNERVLGAGGGKNIFIWVMDTYKPETEIALDVPKDDGPRAVALSPDGNVLAASTFMNVIHLIDMKTKKVTDVLTVHKEQRNPYKHSLAFSPDGKRLASAGGRANETVVLDLESKKVLYRVEGISDSDVMPCAAWSRDGKLLATATIRNVLFWNGANGRFVSGLEPVWGRVHDIAFSPTHDLLAVASTDSILYYRTDKMERIGTEQHKGVSCLAFSRDGKLLITGSSDRSEMNAKIWTVPSVK